MTNDPRHDAYDLAASILAGAVRSAAQQTPVAPMAIEAPTGHPPRAWTAEEKQGAAAAMSQVVAAENAAAAPAPVFIPQMQTADQQIGDTTKVDAALAATRQIGAIADAEELLREFKSGRLVQMVSDVVYQRVMDQVEPTLNGFRDAIQELRAQPGSNTQLADQLTQLQTQTNHRYTALRESLQHFRNDLQQIARQTGGQLLTPDEFELKATIIPAVTPEAIDSSMVVVRTGRELSWDDHDFTFHGLCIFAINGSVDNLEPIEVMANGRMAAAVLECVREANIPMGTNVYVQVFVLSATSPVGAPPTQEELAQLPTIGEPSPVADVVTEVAVHDDAEQRAD